MLGSLFVTLFAKFENRSDALFDHNLGLYFQVNFLVGRHLVTCFYLVVLNEMCFCFCNSGRKSESYPGGGGKLDMLTRFCITISEIYGNLSAYCCHISF